MSRLRRFASRLGLAVTATAALHAQPPRDVERERVLTLEAPGVLVGALDAGRPVVGVSVSTGGAGDTLGVRVEHVTPGGPAAQAGVREGDRIQAINGVSLRRAPSDLEDEESATLVLRRLSREVARARSGGVVELRIVSSGGQARTLRVTPVAASALRGRDAGIGARASGAVAAGRATLGLTVEPTGSARDTLGVFVARVVADGPAERAGILEGDRLQAIDDVDLRVAREDAGDHVAARMRADRLRRALASVPPGRTVALRVYRAGTVRTVRVAPARPTDLRDQTSDVLGAPGARRSPPALAPVAPIPPRPSRARVRPDDADPIDVRIDPGLMREFEARARDAVQRVRDGVWRALEDSGARGTIELVGPPAPCAAVRITRARRLRTDL